MSNQHESSGSRGKAIATPPPPPAPAVNCPRCDSANTKFCYFNNYSLSQPRHFCKACKRYWTRGGALRNVPIGGGCRKTKKANRSPLSGDSKEYSSGASSYSDMGRFKNYDDLDYQLGGGLTKFPSFNSISTTPNVGGQLVSSFGEIPIPPIASSAVSNFGLNLNSETNMSQFMAFNNLPLSYSSPSSILKQDHGENNINIGRFNEGLVPEMGPTNGNLASSMESFSSITQDLHWKLQQERTSMMLNGGVDNNYQQQNVIIGPTNQLESFTQAQKPQPMLFHNLEISSKPAGDSRKVTNGINVDAATANFPTEWYFGNSGHAPAVNQFPSSNGNGKGIQGWANFHQYTSLP